MERPAQPTGTVTLLFSDIEGSTQLLQRLGRDPYAAVLDLHRQLLRGAFNRHGGYEVDAEGDAFFIAFARAEAAVAAAAEAQSALAAASWPNGERILVRMGVHTGEPLAAPPKYVGLDVHKAARIMSAAHGGQVLVSEVTWRLLEQDRTRFVFRDLGEHRLKDLAGAQRLHQLVIEGLSDVFPPPRTLAGHWTNLPSQPNRLIGRERELAEAGALLRAEALQVLTLTGPGGTGKTRLALQIAADAIDDFPDGVFVVFLAATAEHRLVLPAIATALGLRDAAGRSVEDVLADFLRGRRVLLLLDNLEHLPDAAQDLAVLVGQSPVRLLVTSRAPLRIGAEHEYPVPPLGLPEGESVEEVIGAGAVGMFVERARAVRPDFGVDANNAAAVAAICEKVDGLPLALELAAARLRSLAPDALLARLDRRLSLLRGGARDVSERQQTLEATIDWSYRLLEENEQLVLARLSVFAGGFGLDAAEAVCDPEQELGADVLDLVHGLVEKSLLRRGADVAGESRFFMLQTIREYALERLEETGAADEIRLRHALFYTELAEASEPELRGPNQMTWLARLDREHENLLAACTYSLERALPLALRLVGSAYRFWDIRAHWREGLRLAQAVLERKRGEEDGLYLGAVYAFGFLAYPLGKYRESADHLRVAVRVGRALDASRTVALALTDLAWALIEDARQVEDARRYTEEARELTEALDDVWLKGFVAHGRAMSFRHESPEATLPLVEHSCALLEAAGDAINAMRARANVAYCALELGQLDYATSINEEALREARTFGDRYMISCILNNQALIHLLLGRSCEAAGLLYESLDILRRLPAGRVLAETFLIASGIEASGGDAGRAAFLLGGGDAELARLETEMTRVEHQIHDDLVEPLRPGRLEEFDAAYRRGLQAPIEELHDYAAETASMRSGLSSGS